MEPITSLLDAFIKLADRIINLEKAKLQDRKDLFNEIAKPLFEDLQPVALNYLGLFRKARELVSKSQQTDLENIFFVIRDEREAMVMARIKVRQMAQQIETNIDDEETVQFAAAIQNFFYNTREFPDDAISTTISGESRMELGHVSDGEKLVFILSDTTSHTDINIEKLVGYIEGELRTLEISWSAIIQAYEKLKIHSLSSPKYIRKRNNKETKSQ